MPSPRTLTSFLAVLTVAACSGGGAYKRSGSGYRAAPTSEAAGADTGGAAYSTSSPGAHIQERTTTTYDPQPEDRPGLGTEFGEHVVSHVREQPFDRASSDPFATVGIYYNDEDGIRAQAAFRRAELEAIRAYTPNAGISVALTDSYGRVLEGATAGGRTYVIGQDGERYNLVVTNDTGGRYEVVASVDGLDVVDGESAGFGKRGYILGPYSTLTIDGFRTSDTSVAAFRFGAVKDSYAERTGQGRNVGVIGFAFFAEQGSEWTTDELHKRETADPFPSRYAQPPPR